MMMLRMLRFGRVAPTSRLETTISGAYKWKITSQETKTTTSEDN